MRGDAGHHGPQPDTKATGPGRSMRRSRLGRRAGIGAVVTALAVTGAGVTAANAAGTTATTKKVVKKTVTKAAPKPVLPTSPINVQVLSFNDFHGWVQAPSGTSGQLKAGTSTTIQAGGAAYLATHLRQMRSGHPYTLTVAAGDFVGASSPLSTRFQDEPSIDAANLFGLDVTSVGNHEFDEGVTELLRMQYGGCHPTKGCFDADGYAGPKFPYLAANVKWKSGVAVKAPSKAARYGYWNTTSTGRTILPPTLVKNVGGYRVGFIGMTLHGTPSHVVDKNGIKNITFADEVATANLAAKDLRASGAQAIIVLLHEGGVPTSTKFNYSCNSGGSLGLTGPVVTIAKKLDPSIDLVVTGHTHQPYICNIPDPAGKTRYVTSASSFGRLITETTFTLDPKTQDVVRSSVRSQQHPVTRNVAPAPDVVSMTQKWQSLAGGAA